MTEELPIEQNVERSQRPCAKCRQSFESKTVKFETAGISMSLSVTVCNACDEADQRAQKAQRERSEQDRARRQNEAREEAWAKLCPVQFRTETEGGNTVIVRLERESPKLPELLRYTFGPRGLIIRGKTRRCKTRSTWRLLRKLWAEHLRIAAMTAAQFDRDCRDAGGSFTLTQWFDKLARVDVLFIDDLGKAQWSEQTEAQWFDLVDQRTRENRPIIITTNDDGDSLKSRMTPQRAEAMIARLREFCDTLTF